MSTEMTPIEAARSSAKAIQELPATFMMDMQTYIDAAELGYEGIAFYYAGRGGVLGDVDAATVATAFFFFPHDSVKSGWESAAAVESRQRSAERFAGAAHRWAVEHMADGELDYERLADLAGRVVAAADGTSAPVFEGWRRLEEPSGERELVLHRLNALRELRAARHAEAVQEVGLEPVEAFMVRTPHMAGIFGWPEPESGPDDATRAAWERAEELTDERFGSDLSVLDPAELAEFCDLVAAALEAAS